MRILEKGQGNSGKSVERRRDFPILEDSLWCKEGSVERVLGADKEKMGWFKSRKD